jgi:hypothetical protein
MNTNKKSVGGKKRGYEFLSYLFSILTQSGGGAPLFSNFFSASTLLIYTVKRQASKATKNQRAREKAIIFAHIRARRAMGMLQNKQLIWQINESGSGKKSEAVERKHVPAASCKIKRKVVNK